MRPGAVPVLGLDETHLTVSDLPRSVASYRDVVGLPVALEIPERGAAFLWVGGPSRSMLGLWSLGSAPVGPSLHVAFAAALEDLLDAGRRPESMGIAPSSFFGESAGEPSVIGWMPAAAVYLRDPDGHLLEYPALLDEAPTGTRGHRLVGMESPVAGGHEGMRAAGEELWPVLALEGIDLPTTAPDEVAAGLLDRLEDDREDIFPDPDSRAPAPIWWSDPKGMERAPSGAAA